MKKLNSTQTRILKIIHIFFFVSWIGGGICLISVMFLAKTSLPDDIYMKYRSMQVIDDFIIIPGALGSLFTGLIYSILDKLGIFHKRWLTVKMDTDCCADSLRNIRPGPWQNGIVDIAMRSERSSLQPRLYSECVIYQVMGTYRFCF
jgi:hypothetical protein